MIQNDGHLIEQDMGVIIQVQNGKQTIGAVTNGEPAQKLIAKLV